MKIYKLLFLAALACFTFSCSQDKIDQQSAGDSTDRVAADQFDNSYLGVYKGLFTTNDGLTRGSVIMTLSPNNEAIAQIQLNSGEVVEMKSSRIKLTEDNRVDNLRFSSVGLSNLEVFLSFSVEGNGLNPVITAVYFDNKESDILIGKDLSRIPLTPITGTFDCTNCASQGVGFPNGRTWNVMTIGAGNNQSYSVQVAYGGRVYTSPAANNSQNGCVNVVNFTACGVAGSIRILGYDVSWNGTHVYETSNTLACSSVSGSWSAPFYGPGITGTFQSDSDCSNPAVLNDSCTNATSISVGETASGSTTQATNEDTPDFCDDDLFGSADGAGVWYSFESSTDTLIQVDTNGSEFDTQLRVFSGTCGALDCVGNNDDGGDGLQSLFTFTASANTTYYIFIGGYNTAAGNYQLNITELAPPPPFDLDLTCGEFMIDNGLAGAYSANSLDTYTIDAGTGNTINLNFQFFDLEDYYDDLVIYDGPNTSSPIVTTSVGGASNEFGQNGGFTWIDLQDDSIVSSGQYLTLVFSSDVSGNYGGFLAEVVCVSGRSSSNGLQSTNETGERNVISVPRHSKVESGLSHRDKIKSTEYLRNQN